MIRPGVHFEFLAKHLATERSLWKHPEHGFFDDPLGMALEHLGHRYEFLVADIARMMEVSLLLHLPSGQPHLFRIHDDDEITAIHVRCERGLVLATNNLGDPTRQTPQHGTVGIDDVPTVIEFTRFDHVCVHRPTENQCVPLINEDSL